MSEYIQLARVRGNINSDYIQLTAIRGHVNLDYIQIANIRGNQEDHNQFMHKDDFYTLCMKNSIDNFGLRKQSKTHHLATFKTKEVSIDYLCSDFVRFCLSIYKNRQNIDNGEMSLIPKEPIPISEELREYIEEFLPDYYGTRNNVK